MICTNGKFDILHPGHFNLLMYCRKLNGHDDPFYVYIDSDERIKGSTGSWPVFFENERRHHLTCLTYLVNGSLRPLVNGVDVFNSDEELKQFMERDRRSVVVKGSEWAKGQEIIKPANVAALFYPSTIADDFHVNAKISSSKIVERILYRHANR